MILRKLISRSPIFIFFPRMILPTLHRVFNSPSITFQKKDICIIHPKSYSALPGCTKPWNGSGEITQRGTFHL